MIRRVLLLLLGLFSWSTLLAQAQSPITLSDLKISLWPEYDRAEMLVIYRGQTAPDTALPVTLQFQIPARFGPPIAMAYIDNGQLLNLEYTTALDGDSMTLMFSSPNGSFQFEYYDSSLDLSSTTRGYAFATASPYAIQTATVQMQQPIDTTGVTGTPALAAPIVGADGFTYHNLTFTDLNVGDPISLDLTYIKTTDTLTVDSFAPAVTETPTTEQPTPNNWLYGLLGLAGVLLLVGGLIWYAWPKRSSRKNKVPTGSAGRKSGTAKPESGGVAFCHECGQKSVTGDRFCRNCGAELRRSSNH